MEVTNLQSPGKWAPEGMTLVSALLIRKFASLLLQLNRMHYSYETWLPFITSSPSAGLGEGGVQVRMDFDNAAIIHF